MCFPGLQYGSQGVGDTAVLALVGAIDADFAATGKAHRPVAITALRETEQGRYRMLYLGGPNFRGPSFPRHQ